MDVVQEADRREEEERIRKENILSGNPLLKEHHPNIIDIGHRSHVLKDEILFTGVEGKKISFI